MFKMTLLIGPSAPAAVGIFIELGSHEAHDLIGCQTELFFDGIKTRAIFPGHAHDPGEVFLTQIRPQLFKLSRDSHISILLQDVSWDCFSCTLSK